MTDPVEDLLRELAPQVLGVLIRRYGQFDACEDAVQEALLAAAQQWPAQAPANPRGWLLTVATRRLTDEWRSESARRRREVTAAGLDAVRSAGWRRGGRILAASADEPVAPPADEQPADQDDTLTLLFLCCHPELSEPSQVALTLRAVGGLTTAEIARAFFVPEATLAQRISRAKQRIRATGARFTLPPEQDRQARLGVVMHVLYLIFNEGYTTTSGPDLQRTELTAEAIRLTRLVHRQLPDDGEVTGLLALMLLTDARRGARTRPDGSLVPLAEQDRTRWNRDRIAEGVALISASLPHGPVGPYQLQAAIAAVHDEAERAEDTDWVQIYGLYQVLHHVAPNPMATLNQAVALAMVRGPEAGLELLSTLDTDERLVEHHRLPAVRAHLLELAGDADGAREEYRRAARLTQSLPEQRYLQARAAGIRSSTPPANTS